MVNSVTHFGQWLMLEGDSTGARGLANVSGSVGTTGNALLRLTNNLRLFTNATTPNKNNTGFTEASGGAYAAKSITVANWTTSLQGSNVESQLADQTWTASGGSIANVLGAYLTDTDGNVLAWWERSTAITLNDGDSITADDLIVRPT